MNHSIVQLERAAVDSECVYHGVMNEIVNAVEAAQRNLDEANRQVDKAALDVHKGAIGEERYEQLVHLRDICAEDLRRVIEEN